MPVSQNPKLSETRRTEKKVWKRIIAKVLKANGGNREKAADKLGITKRTLYRWLRSQKSVKTQAERSAVHSPVKAKTRKARKAKSAKPEAKLIAKRKRDAENARARRAARKAAAGTPG